MSDENALLWDRIATFPLDVPGAAVPFSARLQRENRWSPAYTLRVIEEYRRFAFLSVAAGHLVSPSDAVDQAWHLHLFYTQSYWGEFCQNALGKALHHNPSQGGRRESRTFDDAYQRTLESYARLFGETPPPDIWPAPEVKQAQRHDFVRVDRASHWVIPKIRSLPLLGFASVALVLIGCASQGDPLSPFNLNGPGFLVFYLCLSAAAAGLALIVRFLVRLPGASDLSTMQDLTPLETACLAGDVGNSLKATVAALVMCGYLKIHPVQQTVEATMPEATGLDPLAAHIVSECSLVGGLPLYKLKASTALSMQAIHDRLVQRQLMLGPSDRLRVGLLAAAIAGAPLLLGVPRIVLGVVAGHAVGFLAILCVVTACVAVALVVNPPFRTIRGDAVLRRQRQTRSNLLQVAERTQPTLPDAIMAVGLFGLAAAPMALQSDMGYLLAPATYNAAVGSCSGGGCGSAGCSGGGCSGGSGCGGGCGG
ncbi:MAG: TIGR04222 domain-containing membrane protein [Fimbriimonadaceae bacterium]